MPPASEAEKDLAPSKAAKQNEGRGDPDPEAEGSYMMSHMHLAQAWEVAALVLFSIVAIFLLVTLCMGHYHAMGHNRKAATCATSQAHRHGYHDQPKHLSGKHSNKPCRQLSVVWGQQPLRQLTQCASTKRKLSFAAVDEEDDVSAEHSEHAEEYEEEEQVEMGRPHRDCDQPPPPS